MTWKKVTLYFLLLCVVGVLFLNELTIHRQRQRIASLEKKNMELQTQVDLMHLQDQLNKSAGRPPAAVPASRPTTEKPAASPVAR
jgi:hypothetical protein